MALAITLLCAGCGGINASHSVSPLDFLLPGILKTDPEPAPADMIVPQMAQIQQVAKAQ